MAKTPKKEGPAREVPQTLEAALKALEEVVEQLEEPELPLENSIEMFEFGTKVSEVAYARLRDAEKKVELLVKKMPNASGKEDFERQPFEGSDA